MPRTWTYETTLPAGMRHTIQVQPDRERVDFNVVVRDDDGQELARDDRELPGAEVVLDTGEEDETVFVSVELATGTGSFSLRVSSRPSDAPPAFKEAEAEALESALDADERAALVEAHNAWRARYDTEPLVWSDELASLAQRWADHLAAQGMELRHRSPNAYGENLFWSKGQARTPKDVVDAWGQEEKRYDHSSKSWWPGAAHFSQVVWKSTRRVGCGVARVGDQEIWVCNYDPRGNWSGESPY